MRRSFPIPLLAAAAIPLLAACGDAPDGAEAEVEAEAERRAAAADSVMLAAEMYDPAVFDTITWESPEAKLERGRVVYGISCSKCHGPSGAGDGEFVMRGDTLRPPSFVAADWQYADDVEGMRRQVFTGTEENMPHWGFYGLKYRDIDAAATYIREVLRAM